MLVLTIIGILAAVALPLYQDFTVRTKVAELIVATGPLKTVVTEMALQNAALDASGVGVTVKISGRVTGGSVTDAGIVTVSGNAASVGTAVTIVLTPSLGAGGKVLWACSTEPSTIRLVPSDCRH